MCVDITKRYRTRDGRRVTKLREIRNWRSILIVGYADDSLRYWLLDGTSTSNDRTLDLVEADSNETSVNTNKAR